VAQCTCGEPDRKEAFNIGHGKTFAIIYNIDIDIDIDIWELLWRSRKIDLFGAVV